MFILRIASVAILLSLTHISVSQTIELSETVSVGWESAVIPEQVAPHEDISRQTSVDWHAWKVMIGLMWPANPNYRGQPALTLNPASDGPRVWETMKEQYEVYPADGSEPKPWNAPQPVPLECQNMMQRNADARILYRTQKVDDVLDAVNQAVKADATLPGTLKDQSGNLVRYEIRFNEVVYDYITANGLYNGERQSVVPEIDFPDGAIIIKAAWKELEEAGFEDRFMTREACICESSDRTDCREAKTGLVGFHVMQKTPDAPQWIWFTFEHVANVRPAVGIPASFNNPNCEGDYCVANSQTPEGVPNQVTQVLPISSELSVINDLLRTEFLLAGWDLANYQLMSAQWPTPSTDSGQPKTVFEVQPTWSANTTMETFAQESSSCMGCHVMSRSLNPDGFVSADFTFTLNNAHPQPEGAICGEYGYSNSMFCSDDIILFSPDALQGFPVSEAEDIENGHALVTQTYERLPEHVGNQLHCSSCHLLAGGDPDAAWWVNMSEYYDTDDKLYDRINGCFERSMNGVPLCKTSTSGTSNSLDVECSDSEPMNDIVAYMDWLTDTYTSEHCPGEEHCSAPRDYPPMETQPVGNIVDGLGIFEQKCAFCHGVDGQGRYESDTYFRPALWGPNSFNIAAGLGKPSLLAQFLRWNMPYTSGGMLTDQEAQDLACFIDVQIRPGKTEFGIDPPKDDKSEPWSCVF